MDYRNKTKRALPYSIAISLLKMLIAISAMKYVVDYLSVAEYAALAMMATFPKLSHMLVAVGYDAYIVRYLPAINEAKKAGDVGWNILAQRLGLISVICILFYFFYRVLGNLNQQLAGFEQHLRVYIPIVLFHVGAIYLRLALSARFLQKYIFFLDFVYQIFRVICILGVIYLRAPFLVLIFCFVFCEGFYFLSSAIAFSLKTSWPNLNNIFWKRRESKREKEYRHISYVNSLGVNFLGSDVNKWILGGFSAALQVSIYTLATQILEKLLDFFPIKMIQPLAEPAMYGKYDEEKEGKLLNKMFQLLYCANNLIGFMTLAIFLPLGRDLILAFFKREYTADAFWPLIVFIFCIIFYSMGFGTVAKAIEKPQILLWSKLSVVANVALGIPLAIKYGAVGMAVASALSIMLKNAIIYLLLRKHIDIWIPWNSTLKGLLNTSITVVILFILKSWGALDLFIGSLNIKFFILAFLGMVIYMTASKFNSIFSSEQKELLLSLVPKSTRRLTDIMI